MIKSLPWGFSCCPDRTRPESGEDKPHQAWVPAAVGAPGCPGNSAGATEGLLKWARSNTHLGPCCPLRQARSGAVLGLRFVPWILFHWAVCHSNGSAAPARSGLPLPGIAKTKGARGEGQSAQCQLTDGRLQVQAIPVDRCCDMPLPPSPPALSKAAAEPAFCVCVGDCLESPYRPDWGRGFARGERNCAVVPMPTCPQPEPRLQECVS